MTTNCITPTDTDAGRNAAVTLETLETVLAALHVPASLIREYAGTAREWARSVIRDGAGVQRVTPSYS